MLRPLIFWDVTVYFHYGPDTQINDSLLIQEDLKMMSYSNCAATYFHKQTAWQVCNQYEEVQWNGVFSDCKHFTFISRV